MGLTSSNTTANTTQSGSGSTTPTTQTSSGIISTVISTVAGVFTKEKDLQIQRQATEQLKIQAESAEDIELYEALQKKLDLQAAQIEAEKAQARNRIVLFLFLIAGITTAGIVAISKAFKLKSQQLQSDINWQDNPV